MRSTESSVEILILSLSKGEDFEPAHGPGPSPFPVPPPPITDARARLPCAARRRGHAALAEQGNPPAAEQGIGGSGTGNSLGLPQRPGGPAPVLWATGRRQASLVRGPSQAVEFPPCTRAEPTCDFTPVEIPPAGAQPVTNRFFDRPCAEASDAASCPPPPPAPEPHAESEAVGSRGPAASRMRSTGCAGEALGASSLTRPDRRSPFASMR